MGQQTACNSMNGDMWWRGCYRQGRKRGVSGVEEDIFGRGGLSPGHIGPKRGRRWGILDRLLMVVVAVCDGRIVRRLSERGGHRCWSAGRPARAPTGRPRHYRQLLLLLLLLLGSASRRPVTVHTTTRSEPGVCGERQQHTTFNQTKGGRKKQKKKRKKKNIVRLRVLFHWNLELRHTHTHETGRFTNT